MSEIGNLIKAEAHKIVDEIDIEIESEKRKGERTSQEAIFSD